MATTVFFTDTASDIDPGGDLERLLGFVRGAGSVNKVTNTTGSGTNIQVTDSAGGTTLVWFSPPLTGVTISGAITINLRGQESNGQANCGRGILIERTNGAGAVQSTILNAAEGNEFTTSDAANASWTPTPTSTTLNTGDRLKVTLQLRNVGTMGSGRTVTYSVNGPTGGAAGDSFLTLTETLAAVVSTVAPAGQPGTERGGQATVTATIVGAAAGLRTGEAGGQATVAASNTIAAAGLPSAERGGQAAAALAGGAGVAYQVYAPVTFALGGGAGGQTIAAAGSPAEARGGQATIVPGPVAPGGAGLASGEAGGQATVSQVGAASGLPGTETGGAATLVASVTIVPAGLFAGEVGGQTTTVPGGRGGPAERRGGRRDRRGRRGRRDRRGGPGRVGAGRAGHPQRRYDHCGQRAAGW